MQTAGPGGTRTDNYTYDVTGNLKTRTVAGVTQTMDWDRDAKVARVAEGAKETSFLYTPGGDRLIRRDPTSITLYLGANELRLDRATNAVTGTRYYTFSKEAVAVRNHGIAFNWLIGDHQGTSQLSIAHSGQSVQRRYQTPFGDRRGAQATNWVGDRSFVGGTEDASTGLVSSFWALRLTRSSQLPGTCRFPLSESSNFLAVALQSGQAGRLRRHGRLAEPP